MRENVTKFDLESAFKALNEIEFPKAVEEKETLDESFFKREDKTEKLVEEYYDLGNKEEVEEAKSERDAEIAKAKLARIEKIVDLDAESPDDLLTSYVGKTIIQCPQCMTLFYKNPEDIEPDENDPNVVNVNEVCQHCGNASGYTLIGKVGKATEDDLEKFDLDSVDDNELDLDFDEESEDNNEEAESEEAENAETTEEKVPEEIPEGEQAEEEEIPKATETEETEEESTKDEEKKNESLNEAVDIDQDTSFITYLDPDTGAIDIKYIGDDFKQALKAYRALVRESKKLGYDSDCYVLISKINKSDINTLLNGQDWTNEEIDLAGGTPQYDVYEKLGNDYVDDYVFVNESLNESVDKELDQKLKDHNDYIEYLQKMIEQEEEALKSKEAESNELVKAAIQRRLDAFKEDLQNALPEDVKDAVAEEKEDLPTPEEAVEEDNKKEESLTEAIKDKEFIVYTVYNDQHQDSERVKGLTSKELHKLCKDKKVASNDIYAIYVSELVDGKEKPLDNYTESININQELPNKKNTSDYDSENLSLNEAFKDKNLIIYTVYNDNHQTSEKVNGLTSSQVHKLCKDKKASDKNIYGVYVAEITDGKEVPLDDYTESININKEFPNKRNTSKNDSVNLSINEAVQYTYTKEQLQAEIDKLYKLVDKCYKDGDYETALAHNKKIDEFIYALQHHQYNEACTADKCEESCKTDECLTEESHPELAEPIEAKKYVEGEKTEVFTEIPDYDVEVEQKGDKVEIELTPKDYTKINDAASVKESLNEEKLPELDGDFDFIGEKDGYKVYKDVNDNNTFIFVDSKDSSIMYKLGYFGEDAHNAPETDEEFYNPITKREEYLTDVNFYLEDADAEDAYNFNAINILPIDLLPVKLHFEGEATGSDETSPSGVKTIEIKDGTKAISKSEFENYTLITEVNIPDSVKSIEDNAFFNCANLKTINLPANLKTIGNQAFAYCYMIDIKLPEGVETIGDYVFEGCYRLRHVTLPASLKAIGKEIFLNCYKLETIDYSGTKAEYDKLNIELPMETSVIIKCSDGEINESLVNKTAPEYVDHLTTENRSINESAQLNEIFGLSAAEKLDKICNGGFEVRFYEKDQPKTQSKEDTPKIYKTFKDAEKVAELYTSNSKHGIVRILGRDYNKNYITLSADKKSYSFGDGNKLVLAIFDHGKMIKSNYDPVINKYDLDNQNAKLDKKLAKKQSKIDHKQGKIAGEEATQEQPKKVIDDTKDLQEKLTESNTITEAEVSDAEVKDFINSDDFQTPVSDATVEKDLDKIENAVEEEIEPVKAEDLHESSINEKLSKYLNEVYSNVDCFEATGCEMNKKNLVVEGNIKFKSGKSRATKFCFEQVNNVSENNSVLYEGYNTDFGNEKQFKLSAILEDGGKLLMTESIEYKYSVDNKLVEGLIR